MKKTYPLSRVYGLLEPGPVVMVTTARKGRPNVMTMSWQTMLDFEPPIFGCVISERQLYLRPIEGDETVRDQHPDGGACGEGRRLWKHHGADNG